MRRTAPIAGLALLCGCVGPVNLAWRGVVNYTNAEATTDGQVHNQPSGNRGSVAADKTNDLDTQVGKPEQAKEQ